MLQVFHRNVAKVDRDVAYVVMVVHVCCKGLSPIHLFFQTYVASVFIWMLHMLQVFYLNTTYVCNDFLNIFIHKRMFQVFYLSSFIRCKCYIWMFQK
jgi:hypothetical protein